MSVAKYVFATTVLFGFLGFASAASAAPCDECWSVSNPDGSKLRGFGVDSITHNGDGVYTVHFARTLNTCSWVGTIGQGQFGANSDPGFITVSGKNQLALTVKTYDTGGEPSDRAFSVQVECK
jgi:hypothetical protein